MPASVTSATDLPAGDFLNQARRARGLVVLMQAKHWLSDIMVEQEHRGVAGIFSCDEIGLAQCLQCSQSDILQVPNGCRDYRKQRTFFLPALRHLCRQLDRRILRGDGMACRSVV